MRIFTRRRSPLAKRSVVAEAHPHQFSPTEVYFRQNPLECCTLHLWHLSMLWVCHSYLLGSLCILKPLRLLLRISPNLGLGHCLCYLIRAHAFCDDSPPAQARQVHAQ